MSTLGVVNVNLYGTMCRVILQEEGCHLDGSRAIQAIEFEDGSPFARLTVCVKGSTLAEGEILVKTWSENEPSAQACLKSGLFIDTGKRVPTGYVEAQVWKLNK